VAWSIKRCTPGVERQIRNVTDQYCFFAVVVWWLAELGVAVDVNNTRAFLDRVVTSNLDQVLIAGNDRESRLRLPTTWFEVVVGRDDVARCGIANVPVIDDDFGVETAAA